MMSRNSGRLRYPNSSRVQISGENRAGRSPRLDKYERGPGERIPKAMSASLASARMKAREEGLALTSASLRSSDFIFRCRGHGKENARYASKFHLSERFFQCPSGLLQRH